MLLITDQATTVQWVSFAGEIFCGCHVSVVICESFIHENQPGIGSRHRDTWDVP